MIKEEVAGSAMSELVSPVLCVPKEIGSVRYSAGYRRVDVITIRDRYGISRMDKFVDLSG